MHFEDRMLAHLEVVIVQKLSRGEHFPMSWTDAAADARGRQSMWLNWSLPPQRRRARCSPIRD